MTALDIGARLIVRDAEGRVTRIEEVGRRFAADQGLSLAEGSLLDAEQCRALAAGMADRLFDAIDGGRPSVDGAELLRLDPLTRRSPIAQVSFSGGVAEYIYGGDTRSFGDLGVMLAQEIRARSDRRDLQLVRPDARIRATVIGASQYTMQVAAAHLHRTIGRPAAAQRAGDRAGTRSSGGASCSRRCGRHQGGARPSTSWTAGCRVRAMARIGHRHRLDGFCRGVAVKRPDCPWLSDRAHRRRRRRRPDRHSPARGLKLACPIVSVDGGRAEGIRFHRIGAMLDTAGAVPVVIKSLIFPGSPALGRSRPPTSPFQRPGLLGVSVCSVSY